MRSDPVRWRVAARCSAEKDMCVAVSGDLTALRDTKTGKVIGAVNVAALVQHVKV